MKYCYIDIETSGLDPIKDNIIEIGLIVIDHRLYPSVEQEYSWKVRFSGGMSEDAQKINGYSDKEWEHALPLQSVMLHLNDVIHDGVLVGANIAFDWSFLSKAFSECGITPLCYYRKIDMPSMVYMDNPSILFDDLKLKNICKNLGVEPEPDVHRAINGARCVRDCHRLLISRTVFK